MPFIERIRPGMVVRWTPPTESTPSENEQNLALILCSQATGETVRDGVGNLVDSDGSSGQRWLCAMVLPGVLGDSYEVHLWRQAVVDVGQMQAEVILEYDVATRYYHITV